MTSPTLADILSIPGNQPVFDELVKLVKEHRALAFVGAGASAGLYPMWGKFINDLSDHAVAKSKAEPKDAERWKRDYTSTPQQRVNNIIRKLGNPLYREFLKASFGPTRGADGKRYTPTHAALLRMPFRGYVTTNYDPALDFARAELRPQSLSTGTPTWQDDDEVYLWRTGEVFSRDCPMLWLHGYWQRPDGIVLNSGEYSQAYKPGIYRDTFKELWIRERLLFLGFGFNDPQFNFMVGEFLRDLTDANAAPRHIAILGWSTPTNDAAPDEDEIREKRESLEADYHLRPLFYSVTKNGAGEDDHAALDILLEGVASRCDCPEFLNSSLAGNTSVPKNDAVVCPFQAKWVHETTNDAKFVGREDEIERLDRWMRDTSVRVVAVCAVGGTGKTALIGHWLKNTSSWRSRPFKGLFAWSFYQNRNTEDFLRQFLLWCSEAFGTTAPNSETKLVFAALAIARTTPCVLVLDGLEVIQEGPEGSLHGAFLDGALREFLNTFCQNEHESVAVLTSRFVFVDLERYLGTAFHQLELHGLPATQGASLLSELSVGGIENERRAISVKLDGHPLGLRVFAWALPDTQRETPQHFLDFAFTVSKLPEDALLARRMASLLRFYQRKLSLSQTRLLGVVSFFRVPVPDEAVLRIVRGLFGRKKKDPIPSDAALADELKLLHTRGFLTREPVTNGYGSACHPILRDHFRSVLLGSGAGTARRAANLLADRPLDHTPQMVTEIEPVIAAIELLLDADEFEEANQLFESRLALGEAFKWIPAPSEGLSLVMKFVGDGERREKCARKLSNEKAYTFLSWAAFLSTHSANYDLASEYFDLCEIWGKTLNFSQTRRLWNRAELCIFQGSILESITYAEWAVTESKERGSEFHLVFSLVSRGWANAMRGDLQRASEDFSISNLAYSKLVAAAKWREQFQRRIIWSAEHLLRNGLTSAVELRVQRALEESQFNGWNYNVARCHWALAWCALLRGQFDEASATFHKAAEVFRRGQLLFDMSRVYLGLARVSLARGDTVEAIKHVSDCLSIALPRRIRLAHADALILRGSARLLEGGAEGADRALDDANDALRLARDCGYAWAERDALLLKADAAALLANSYELSGHAARAEATRRSCHSARATGEAMSLKLHLSEDDLVAADAKAALSLSELRAQTMSGKLHARRDFTTST